MLEAAQALAFLDLGAQHCGAFGRDRAGGAVSIRIEDELEVRAMAGVVFAHAMTCGLAPLGTDFAHDARAQIADGCNAAVEDASASLF